MSSAFSRGFSGPSGSGLAANRSGRSAGARPTAIKAQPRSFKALLSRFINFLYTSATYGYRKLRSLLWIGSTGIIFLLIPIMYSKVVETEMEFLKLERASDLAAGKVPLGGGGGANMRSF